MCAPGAGDCPTEPTAWADVVIDTVGPYCNDATLGSDLDGDGRNELVTGVFYWTLWNFDDEVSVLPAGEVQIFRGATLGASPSLTLDDASLTLTGPAVGSSGEGEVVGTSLAPVADLDGGGSDDLLVGAYWGPHGDGCVRLVMGEGLPETGSVPIADVATVEYLGDGWHIGSTLLSADFDGDSRSDMLISGHTTSLVWGAEPGEGTVALADVATSLPDGSLGDPGDVDGDGLDDLLLDPVDVGPRLYLGATLAGRASLSEADADVVFVSEGGIGGASLDVLGGRADVDGDGLPDILDGDGTLATYVLYGDSVLGSSEVALVDADIRVFRGGAVAARDVSVGPDGSASLRVWPWEGSTWYWTCSIPLSAPGGAFDEADCFDTYRIERHEIFPWWTSGDVTGDGTTELLLSVEEEDWDDALYLLFDQY